ncbi:hypothetical protein [Novipirellula caenicola]|uniref:Uncharacterized protein n=1 Tax=Novipirellula caenicola TaxID=1536901 RepID=A0ABP9VKC2_9BACT
MPDDLAANLERRLHRLEVCAAISLHASEIHPRDALAAPGVLVGVTASRLGRDPHLHRRVCQFLSRRMLDLRQSQSTLLVAAGSAIEPLAARAAELFDVPIIHLVVSSDDSSDHDPARVCRIESSEPLSRDAVLIGIADRVDAVYIRPGGKIDSSLRSRITALRDPSTRVAVITDVPSAAVELIAQGAIGWYMARLDRSHHGQSPTGDQSATTSDSSDSGLGNSSLGNSGLGVSAEDHASRHLHLSHDTGWTRSDGQWLTHTTRSCDGPWPGQTEHQYQDELLLNRPVDSESTDADHGPLQTLARIVRSGVIAANAITSSKKYPVVCFSEVPLADRLHHRKFRSHLGRWDDEPYGIAIRLEAAKRLGFKPVIYGDPKQRKQIATEDQYRFQAKGKTFDWTREREWRSDRSVDLTQLNRDDVRIFLPSAQEAETLRPIADWQITLLGDDADRAGPPP